jgi:hypothetical protein
MWAKVGFGGAIDLLLLPSLSFQTLAVYLSKGGFERRLSTRYTLEWFPRTVRAISIPSSPFVTGNLFAPPKIGKSKKRGGTSVFQRADIDDVEIKAEKPKFHPALLIIQIRSADLSE